MKFLILCTGFVVGAIVAIPTKARLIDIGGDKATQSPLLISVFIIAYVGAGVSFWVSAKWRLPGALWGGIVLLTAAVIWSM